MPAASIAAILSSASPLPPEMMAPAWPIRRPGRRGAAGDEADHRLLAAFLRLAGEECRRFLLGRAADLADHDDRLRLRVGKEEIEYLDELGALHRIAADPDGRGLAEALVRGLEHRFIGERAGARHDADRARLEDVRRHDADLAFAGGDDARAVRADQARLRAVERALHAHHVEDRDALGDADDQRDLGVDRLADRICGASRRHVDDRGVGAGRGLRLDHGVEDRQAEMCRCRPCPARCRRPSWCRRRSPARSGTCRSRR